MPKLCFSFPYILKVLCMSPNKQIQYILNKLSQCLEKYLLNRLYKEQESINLFSNVNTNVQS